MIGSRHVKASNGKMMLIQNVRVPADHLPLLFLQALSDAGVLNHRTSWGCQECPVMLTMLASWGLPGPYNVL